MQLLHRSAMGRKHYRSQLIWKNINTITSKGQEPNLVPRYIASATWHLRHCREQPVSKLLLVLNSAAGPSIIGPKEIKRSGNMAHRSGEISIASSTATEDLTCSTTNTDCPDSPTPPFQPEFGPLLNFSERKQTNALPSRTEKQKNTSLSRSLQAPNASARRNEPPRYPSSGGSSLALHPGVSLYALGLFFLADIARFAQEQLLHCRNCYMEGLVYFPTTASVAPRKCFLSLICRDVC